MISFNAKAKNIIKENMKKNKSKTKSDKQYHKQ